MEKTRLAIFLVATMMLSFNVKAAGITIYDKDLFITNSDKTHKITLLNHGMASFEERLQMIERAQKSIDVEYFIYRTDRSAKILTQALVKKAREGVKVRVLLDYFLAKKDFTPFYAHELEKSGAEVKYFNTVSSLKIMSAQYRNHRKAIIIDGKEVITGGRNIGDEYFDLHPVYTFLDRDIRFEGAVVTPIKETFDETFNAELSKHLDRNDMPFPEDPKYRRGDQENYHAYKIELAKWQKNVAEAKSFFEDPVDSEFYESVRAQGKTELNLSYKGICKDITFRSEYPNLGKKNRKGNRVLKYDIFSRIEDAKESIMMESPYYIINDELGKSIAEALDRNVKVKAVTNSLNSSDAPYVYAAFDTIIPKWLDRGLDSYIFVGSKPDYYSVHGELTDKTRYGVHAKTIVFDHKDVMIGTYNIDPRSANYNSEMSVTCENNPELAAAVENDMELRMASSINLDSQAKIKEAEFNQIKFGKKIIYYLSKGISYGFGFLL